MTRGFLFCVLLVTSFSSFYCQQCVLSDDELDALAEDPSNIEQSIVENRIMKAVLKNAAAELDRISPIGVLKKDAVAGVDGLLKIAEVAATGLDEAASRTFGVVDMVEDGLQEILYDLEAGVTDVLTNVVTGLDEAAPLTRSILNEVADGMDEVVNINGVASRVDELLTNAATEFREALPRTFGVFDVVTDGLDEVLEIVSVELDKVWDKIESDVDIKLTNLAAEINGVLKEAADRLEDEAAVAPMNDHEFHEFMNFGLLGGAAAAVGGVLDNVASSLEGRRFGVLDQVADELKEVADNVLGSIDMVVKDAVAGVEGAFKTAVGEVNGALLKIVAGGGDVALKIVGGGVGGVLKISSGLVDRALEVAAGGVDVALQIAGGIGQAVSNTFGCNPAKWLGCAPLYASAYAECFLAFGDEGFLSDCVRESVRPECSSCHTLFADFVQDCTLLPI